MNLPNSPLLHGLHGPNAAAGGVGAIPGVARWSLRRSGALIVATFFGLATAAVPTSAQTWVDVAPAARAGLLQWDRESLVMTADDLRRVTWRTAGGQSTTLYRGAVDCRAVSVRIDSARYVATGSSPGTYSGADLDFAAGTRTWDGHVNRLTDVERAAGDSFPVPGDHTALLIDAVCAGPAGALVDRRPQALALQAQLGCPAATGANGAASRPGATGMLPSCSKDPAYLGKLGLLDLRLRQATDACRLDRPRADRLATAWQALPGRCDSALQPVSCGPAAVDAALAGLGTDLGRAAAGLACIYVPQTLAEAADGATERAARARFHACAAHAIPRLDDRLSQADVVAKGVFGACRGELPASVAQGSTFENGLLPGLTADVLAHRNGGRRVVLPTRPSRGEAR